MSTKKRHGKGVGIVIHGKIESKRDPFLQQRIDQVVKAAQERERDHSTDVVCEYRKLRFGASGLKCHQVG